MEGGDTVLAARPDESTAALTTGGQASGRLVGGNLDTIAACAGLGAAELDGAILLLEAVEMQPGQVDRQLTDAAQGGTSRRRRRHRRRPVHRLQAFFGRPHDRGPAARSS